MHPVKNGILFFKLSMKQQVMENENLFELQMCQGLISLILQSLKLNVVETINPKTKTKKWKEIIFLLHSDGGHINNEFN
jgi:hypothetical protein